MALYWKEQMHSRETPWVPMSGYGKTLGRVRRFYSETLEGSVTKEMQEYFLQSKRKCAASWVTLDQGEHTAW